VCTQQIVHTMLKDSEISRITTRRTHRAYTPEFKAQLVAACQQPGASIAALAGQHGMNAHTNLPRAEPLSGDLPQVLQSGSGMNAEPRDKNPAAAASFK
jgi:hypothetical protein